VYTVILAGLLSCLCHNSALQAKAFDRQTSALHYLVSIVQKNDEDVLKLSEDLVPVKAAERVAMDILAKEMKDIKNGIELVKDVVKRNMPETIEVKDSGDDEGKVERAEEDNSDNSASILEKETKGKLEVEVKGEGTIEVNDSNHSRFPFLEEGGPGTKEEVEADKIKVKDEGNDDESFKSCVSILETEVDTDLSKGEVLSNTTSNPSTKVQLLATSEMSEDELLRFTPMGRFSLSAASQIQELSNQFDDAQRSFTKLLQFFGEDKSMTAEAFFCTINTFVSMFDQTHKDLKKKEEAKERRKRIEEKKKLRMQEMAAANQFKSK